VSSESFAERYYYDERVRLPAEEDARLAFLRGVVDEGASRGWKLISALREPDGEALLLTWEDPGALPG
jgi:hypothetical protein